VRRELRSWGANPIDRYYRGVRPTDTETGVMSFSMQRVTGGNHRYISGGGCVANSFST